MTTSLCCVECFHDDTIKKIITGHQNISRCHYCNTNRVATIQLTRLIQELTSTFEGLSDMFEEDNDGLKLIEVLDTDFRIFSQRTNKERIKLDKPILCYG